MKNITKSLILATVLIGVNLMGQNFKPVQASLEQISVRPTITNEWDKTFKKSELVNHKKVVFKNRFGIELVGDLYTPKNTKGKLRAIAVAGPFGAVKEQSSGLYAQTLAERGFITLAFDPSFTGESGGDIRALASVEINTDDFSAAVDYLSNLDNVDSDKIGILGICGWGGFALNAAIVDTRIKAVATSTMYDMTRVMARGYNDNIDENARYQVKKALVEQRTQDYKNGTFSVVEADEHLTPQSKITADTPQFVKNYSNYYKTERGYHKRSINSNAGWTTTTPISFMNFKLLDYADELKTPVLIVAGEKAHSRYFSEDAFRVLGSKNKELLIVPNAVHIDLYDNIKNKIPYDKFESFFKDSLR